MVLGFMKAILIISITVILHRYSNVDRCDYELVDGWTNESIEYYDNYQCNLGYDLCADDRDYYNRKWITDIFVLNAFTTMNPMTMTGTLSEIFIGTFNFFNPFRAR